MKTCLGPAQGQSGQALVEYVLVLVVVVSIALGILYQFNSAFRVYMTNYFGNYIACLLETGELPAIAGGGGGICTDEMQAFDINNGTQRPGVGQTGSSGSSKSQTSAAKRGQSTPRGSSDSREPAARTADNSSGSSRSSSAGSSSARRSAASARRPAGELSDGQKSEAQALGLQGSRAGIAAGQLSRPNVSNRVALGGRFLASDEERAAGKPAKIPAGTRASNGLKPKTMKVNMNPLRAKSAGDDDTGFTFGNFLRLLLIAAIIIALLVLVGGQALQISKSWEKG